jgi:predicted CxxxxCH...CXXCH cytochrome family protein
VWKQLPAIAMLFAGAASCSIERPRARPEACLDWVGDVGPLLSARCLDCHSRERAAGGYELESYLGALAGGSDGVPNALAGDERSRILTALDPRTANEAHRAFEDLVPALRRWVVECDLEHRRSRLHEPGILDPRSGDFHGELLAGNGYDFAYCAECHGEDFGGGAAESSCTSCHREGPTDCATCHREDLLDRGAHRAHLPNGVDFDDCGGCHETPSEWDPAHATSAEVRFSGFAATDPRALFDRVSSTCSEVYCHGATLDPAIAAPSWFAGEEPGRCGSCHGVPPADHASDRCAQCHTSALAGGAPDPRFHVDGVVQVGRSEGECTACHGDLDSPAPPNDLDGRRERARVTVGAHRPHLEGRHRLRAPIECGECHRVPAAVADEGHIDSEWPSEVIFGSLSTARGASPSWDRESASCAGVYCHGGANLGVDLAPSVVRAPSWTSIDESAVVCGACHGVPPEDAAHAALGEIGIRDCAHCHPSVDDFGNVLFSGATTLHLDGAVDVR